LNDYVSFVGGGSGFNVFSISLGSNITLNNYGTFNLASGWAQVIGTSYVTVLSLLTFNSNCIFNNYGVVSTSFSPGYGELTFSLPFYNPIGMNITTAIYLK